MLILYSNKLELINRIIEYFYQGMLALVFLSSFSLLSFIFLFLMLLFMGTVHTVPEQ